MRVAPTPSTSCSSANHSIPGSSPPALSSAVQTKARSRVVPPSDGRNPKHWPSIRTTCCSCKCKMRSNRRVSLHCIGAPTTFRAATPALRWPCQCWSVEGSWQSPSTVRPSLARISRPMKSGCSPPSPPERRPRTITLRPKTCVSASPNLKRRWSDSRAVRLRRQRPLLPGRLEPLLLCEQSLLASHAPPVATAVRILADDAVTGNDHRDRVRAAGAADSACGFRLADYRRDLAIRASLPVWDRAQRLPDSMLKSRSTDVQGDAVQRRAAVQVCDDFFHNGLQRRIIARDLGTVIVLPQRFFERRIRFSKTDFRDAARRARDEHSP